ncbi:MAG: hypothetical protein K2X93_19455 [Candidatus Obscuribacterales bacterium]|nr:hypothetical protein [Candidatus Obscuribacterales bacterium]
MVPSLPDYVELRVQIYTIGKNGFNRAGFSDFETLDQTRNEEHCIWLHLSGSLNDEFWKELRKFADLSDEQLKSLKLPQAKSFVYEQNNGVFWSVRHPFVSDSFDGLETVNFLLCDRVLITRQFSHDDVFRDVVNRYFAMEEEVSEFGADRLAADLLESVIHAYHDVLTVGGAKLERLQTRIIRNPGKSELELINRAQQMIWIFLKSVWPLETISQSLSRSRSKAISNEGRFEFSQCHNEAESILRLFETYREMSYDIMDVYVSGLGLRTNEITKILTIIATLFMPPTFIAGVYGMNFKIPEVDIPLGYYLCLGVMVLVSVTMLIWLRRKGFLDI